MRYSIKIFFFSFFLFSCHPKNQNTSNSSNFSVPEPRVSDQLSISDPQKARFKLTEISVIKKPSLRVNDNIVFSGIKNIEENEDAFNKVKLQIKTHCLIDDQQVIIENYTRTFTPSIPIIELLPEEVLLSHNTPSCSFSFKAENPQGAKHYFTVPQLPITEHHAHRFITIIDTSKIGKNNSPYLFVNKRKEYDISTGHETAMDTLNLKCHHLSDSVALRSEQWFPFSAFSNELDHEIIHQNPYQKCRILGYNQDILVAASQVFYLVYPHQPPYVSIETIDHNPDNFYNYVMGIKEDNKSEDVEMDMYSYKINNPHSYPVTLWMSYRPNMDLDIHSLYQEVNYNGMDYTEDDKMYLPFYVSNEFHINFRNIIVEQGQANAEYTDKGLFLELQPQSTVKIPVFISEDNFCKKAQTGDEVRWLGALYTFPRKLRVYVLDVKDKNFSESSIELNIHRSDETIKLLTSGLQKQNSDDDTLPILSSNLWFMESSCSQTSRNRDKTFRRMEPLLELRREHYNRGSFDVHWLAEPDPLLFSTYKEKITTTKTAILYYIDDKNPFAIHNDGMGGGTGE